MKNITLTIDDELYERSRILAAERKTTVTGLHGQDYDGVKVVNPFERPAPAR